MSAKCKYIKENGTSCEAYAMSNKDYCFMHDPESAARRFAVQQDGGSKHVVLYNSLIKLRRGKIRDVMRFLAKTVTEVRDGNISPQVANSVFMGCNSLIKCFELYDVERKVTLIEKQLEDRNDEN